MSYPRLAMRLYNTPLLLSEDKMHAIETVFRMHEQGTPKLLTPYEAPKARPEVAAPGQAQRTQSGYVRTADGIAVVSVLGTLVHRSGFMDAESGLTSYMDIGNQLASAIADPQVHGILLEIDSSGGEVTGIFDLADEMRAYAQQKPMIAHANEQALSGGYVLAAAANEIYTPRTGLIGSIGVRMMHVDQSQYDAKRGIVYTDIVAGARKADGGPHEPLSDAARQWAQDHVDHTYAIFVDYVAESRGIDQQAVRDTEAAIYHADDAVALGLIDGTATIGETLQILRDRVAAKAQGQDYGMRAAANADRTSQIALSGAERNDIMAGENKGTTAAVAGPTNEDVENAKLRGYNEGKAEGEKTVAQAAAAAAKASQDRIAGILSHAEAQGRRALAEHFAFATQLSIEDAAAALAKAPKDAPAAAAPANPLAAAMKDVPNPKVGPDAPSDGEETAQSLAASILSAGKRKLKVVGEAK